MGRPGSFRRACQCRLLHPLGACRLGQWLCRPLGTGDGCRAGHGGDLTAVAVHVQRVLQRRPPPLPAVRCAKRTRSRAVQRGPQGSGTACPYGTQCTGYLVPLACLGHPACRAWLWALNPP